MTAFNVVQAKCRLTHTHKSTRTWLCKHMHLHKYDLRLIFLRPEFHIAFPFPYTHTSPLVSLSSSVSHVHTYTHTHLHPLLHQWSSHSLPLTSQQAVFHLPQIALVCHPKLCLQSCLPTPLQHIAHLIGLRTPFWICKSRSCIIIRNIQMKDSAVNWHFWMCWWGGFFVFFVFFHSSWQWCWLCKRFVTEQNQMKKWDFS